MYLVTLYHCKIQDECCVMSHGELPLMVSLGSALSHQTVLYLLQQMEASTLLHRQCHREQEEL